MAHREAFWKLEHLSDAQLLESLSSVLRTQHRTLAALVAHLAEVEERRLHLEAAYSSMFAYCVGRLGMSEDEACRRIDLARLARRFPALFVELESGTITLSVALLLKPVLTRENHRELLCASRGKSTQQARELLAARFPKDDVPSSIRKLPERRPARASEPARTLTSAPALASAPAPAPMPASEPAYEPAPASSPAPAPSSAPALSPASEQPIALPPLATAAALSPPRPAPVSPSSCMHSEPSGLSPASAGPRPSPAPPAPAPASRGSIEPLSAERYRIQFTADAELKRKLELARDLLRHAHPSGDFAAILLRALNLLLDDLQRRRFGAPARRKSAPTAKAEGSSPAKSDPRSHPGVPPPTNAAPPHAAESNANAHSAVAASPSAPLPVAESDASGGGAMQPGATTPDGAQLLAPGGAHSAVAASPSASPPSASSDGSERATTSAPANPAAKPVLNQPGRSHIPRAARRAVLERDGLGCSWVDAHGGRCGSRAWLELDHRQPFGKGGSSEPDNVRLLCRAHNQLAAEHAYGRARIERARRLRERAAHRARKALA